MIKNFLFINRAESKGKGVFTNENIAADKIIEESPVIVMSAEDRVNLDKTLLHDYIFAWGEKKEKCCVALGFVSMYNHNYQSNCEYFMDFEEETIQVKTVKNIKAGEELTINYNGDWNDKKKIWFEVH